MIERLLDVLLDERFVGSKHILNAGKLLSSFQYYGSDGVYSGINVDISIRCLKCSFRFLEETSGVPKDDSRSRNVAAMFHLSLLYSSFCPWLFLYSKSPEWHKPGRFDMLVDYLMQICEEEKNYVAIGDAFWVLAGLRGSPGTLEGKRVYIDRIIRFMSQDTPLRTRHAAMRAGHQVRTDITSLGQDDGPLIISPYFSHSGRRATAGQ